MTISRRNKFEQHRIQHTGATDASCCDEEWKMSLVWVSPISGEGGDYRVQDLTQFLPMLKRKGKKRKDRGKVMKQGITNKRKNRMGVSHCQPCLHIPFPRFTLTICMREDLCSDKNDTVIIYSTSIFDLSCHQATTLCQETY